MQPSVENQDHHALLEAHLRALGLPAFLELYQSYARDAARNGLSPEQFLLGLCEAEMSDRDVKRIEAAIRRARFPFIKELTDYDFTVAENIPKTTILELAQGATWVVLKISSLLETQVWAKHILGLPWHWPLVGKGNTFASTKQPP